MWEGGDRETGANPTLGWGIELMCRPGRSFLGVGPGKCEKSGGNIL